MLPLTLKQTKSMVEMQKIQPKLKELQEKYKNDKEKLQKEMLKFYSEHKINPLGGCLPLLLQIPIFWALFRMLVPAKGEESFLKGASFLWLEDLSRSPSFYSLGKLSLTWAEALPYYILILLIFVSSYLPQKMITSDPQQEKTMIFMTLFIAFIAWKLPAGVLIYWITTNIWQIGQQYIQIFAQGKARGKT